MEICHATVRFWWHRFGPMFAAEIRNRRIAGMKSSRWRRHLDEVCVKIDGERHYLWRAVDHEGEVLDSLVKTTRNRKAVLEILNKPMRRCGQPEAILNDPLRSHGVALKVISAVSLRETDRWHVSGVCAG